MLAELPARNVLVSRLLDGNKQKEGQEKNVRTSASMSRLELTYMDQSTIKGSCHAEVFPLPRPLLLQLSQLKYI